MFSKHITAIRKNFPHLPATKAHFYIRLFVFGYLSIVFLVLLWVSPITKAANMCSLVLQIGSAALLWWESTAVLEHMDLVSDELELLGSEDYAPTSPERLLDVVASTLSFLVFFGAIFLVAFEIFIRFPSGQIESLIKAELAWSAIGIALFAVVRITSRSLQKSLAEHASRIRTAREQHIDQARDATRRAIRSIAFAVFFVGALIQLTLASLV